MKTNQSKSSVEKQEIDANKNTNVNTKSSIYPRGWNSTMLDFIGLVVLSTLLLGLSQSMRIELDSQKEKEGKDA